MISVPQLCSPPPAPQQLDPYDSSPLFLRRSSLTSSLNDEDEDDGFLEILDDHGLEVPPPHTQRPVVGRLRVTTFVPPQDDSGMPMGMESLLTAPLVADGAADSVSWKVILNLVQAANAPPCRCSP